MLSSWSVGQIWFVSLPFSVENFQLWPWKPGLKRLGWFKETKILYSICREERKTVLEVTVHDRNKTPSITHPAFTRSGIKRRSQRGRRRRGFLRKQNICYKKKLWFTRLEKEQRETFEFGLLTRQVQCSSVVLDPYLWIWPRLRTGHDGGHDGGHHFLGVESVREGLETIFQFASQISACFCATESDFVTGSMCARHLWVDENDLNTSDSETWFEQEFVKNSTN